MNGTIKVCDIEKYYGTKDNITKAVNRISFEVRSGEFVGVMGASGSGKTTLLNLLQHKYEYQIGRASCRERV